VNVPCSDRIEYKNINGLKLTMLFATFSHIAEFWGRFSFCRNIRYKFDRWKKNPLISYKEWRDAFSECEFLQNVINEMFKSSFDNRFEDYAKFMIEIKTFFLNIVHRLTFFGLTLRLSNENNSIIMI
jgi:hypothetical protein